MTIVETLEKRRTGNTPSDNYTLSYFTGKGSLYPDSGDYLNPNSEYRKRFIDMAKWINTTLKGEGTVIDVGGGPGHLGYWMNNINSNIKVVHTDLSTDALVWGKQNYTHDAVQLSATDLPFPFNYAKGVIYADILEHLETEDAVKALNEGKRILQNMGHIFINIPNRYTWTKKTFQEPSHIWIPTPHDMKEGLSEIGFKDIKISTRGFPFSTKFRNITNKDLHLPFGGTSIFVSAVKQANSTEFDYK